MAAFVVSFLLFLFACCIHVHSQNACNVRVNQGETAFLTFNLNSLTGVTLLRLVRSYVPGTSLLECSPNTTGTGTWTCTSLENHFTSQGPQTNGTLIVEVRGVTKSLVDEYILKGFQDGANIEPVTCDLFVNPDVVPLKTTPAPTEDSEDSSETGTNAASIVIPIVIICVVVVGILACVLLYKFVPKFADKVRSLCKCCPCWKNQQKDEPNVAERGDAKPETVPLVQTVPGKKEDNGRGAALLAEQKGSRPGSASAPNGSGDNNETKARPLSTSKATPPRQQTPVTPAAAAAATPSTQPAQSPAAAADIKPEDISRDETEKRLLSPDQKDGAFIIRLSQGTSKAVTLAVRRSSDKVTYHMIDQENGRFKLEIKQDGKDTILLFDKLQKLKDALSNKDGLFDLERFRDTPGDATFSPQK